MKETETFSLSKFKVSVENEKAILFNSYSISNKFSILYTSDFRTEKN